MKKLTKLFRLSGLGLLALLSTQTFAAGYRLEFQSASVLADAGEAAVVEDVSTNFYNAAGLVYLPQQLVASAIDVYAPATFSGTATALPIFGAGFAATGRASSHPNTILPAFHYGLPINSKVAVGISVVPAWGFTEDYGEGSILRYSLTRVYTKTILISPSVAWRFTDQWSLGIGPDFHYFEVSSKSHVRTEVLTPVDSTSRFTGNNWSVGGHAGLLYRISEATRVGLNYRTKIVTDLQGYSDFVLGGTGGAVQTNSRNFSLTVPLPPTTTLSAYHDINPQWALMGTIAYDQWNVIKQYVGHNVASIGGAILPAVVLPQRMSNTVDASIGTHYKLNERLMLRGSLKYVATPTTTQFRTVTFPDGPKLGINLGARYTVNPKLALDFIYGHVFVKTVGINDVNPLTGAIATGRSRTTIDLLGAQAVWSI